jgi:hypothetical protein
VSVLSWKQKINYFLQSKDRDFGLNQRFTGGAFLNRLDFQENGQNGLSVILGGC